MTFDTARETSDAVNFILRKFSELALNDPLQAQSLDHEHPKESVPTYLVASDEARTEVKEHADFTCDEVDDHDEIMTAVGALPFSGGRVQLSEGEFRPAWGEIVLNRGTHLQGMGRGATELIMPGTATGDEIAIKTTLSGRFSMISDLDILMSNSGTSIQRGVKLIGQLAILRNVGIVNSRGVGVEITSTGDGAIIEDSDISFSTGDNITIASADRCKIHRNHIEGGDANGIVLSGTTRHAQIMANHIFNQDGDGAVLGATTLYNMIQGNILEAQGLGGTPGTGIVVGGTFQQILHNLIAEAAHHGIDLTGADDCVVIANMIHHSGTLTSDTFDNIFLSASDRNLIALNQLISRISGGTTRYGINISTASCDDNIVVSNDLGPGADYGSEALNDVGTDTRLTYPDHAKYGDNFTLGAPVFATAAGIAAPSALITATVVP